MIPPASTPAAGQCLSPCVRQCCLDNADVCIGCGRLLSEITGWMAFSCEQKQNVLLLAQERVALRRKLFGGPEL
ncbi:MAG: hypothetical protein RL497_438 [Pseudomonadota bacterium]|jgi:uncharacterized protein